MTRLSLNSFSQADAKIARGFAPSYTIRTGVCACALWTKVALWTIIELFVYFQTPTYVGRRVGNGVQALSSRAARAADLPAPGAAGGGRARGQRPPPGPAGARVGQGPARRRPARHAHAAHAGLPRQPLPPRRARLEPQLPPAPLPRRLPGGDMHARAAFITQHGNTATRQHFTSNVCVYSLTITTCRLATGHVSGCLLHCSTIQTNGGIVYPQHHLANFYTYFDHLVQRLRGH